MDYVLGENQYGRYYIPVESRHRPAAQAILAGDVWEPATTVFEMDGNTLLSAG